MAKKVAQKRTTEWSRATQQKRPSQEKQMQSSQEKQMQSSQEEQMQSTQEEQMQSSQEEQMQSSQAESRVNANRTTQSTKTPDNEGEFPLLKGSYKLLIIGIAIIILGFILMMGGGSDNPDNFNYAIFSFRRITLAPIVVLIGFIFIFWVIIRKDKGVRDMQQ